jgi:hypothetical protein
MQGETDDDKLSGFAELFAEIQRAVEAKQLKPMLRTQYMRTVFEVRASSSAALCCAELWWACLPWGDFAVGGLPAHYSFWQRPPCALVVLAAASCRAGLSARRNARNNIPGIWTPRMSFADPV